MSLFTTFGTFSIAAGILLIFLIFVMLAAERRGELGIARAVGTRRGHLVQMFTFEGAAYDLIAAAVGALLGAAIAYGMVLAIGERLRRRGRGCGPQGRVLRQSREPLRRLRDRRAADPARRRVLRLARERDDDLDCDPEPPRASAAHIVGEGSCSRSSRSRFGVLLTMSGASGDRGDARSCSESRSSSSGSSRSCGSCGVPERLAYTSCGLAIAVAMLLPWSVWEAVFGQMSMDFSTWIVSGLMTVIGAVWVMVYNADLILRGDELRPLARSGSSCRSTRMAITYPLRARFRTGATLAMFTLVVFTLVTGTATPSSFRQGVQQRRRVRRRLPGARRHLGGRADRRPAAWRSTGRRESTRPTSPRSAASRCSR